MAQGLHHLDDAADARGSLRVTDVRLQRPEPHRPLGTPLPVGRDQRLRLDRIAERGAGPVCLDRVDIGRLQAGAGERGADDALLGRTGRRRESVGRAVLVDRAAAEDGEHLVAALARDRQALEHEHADAVGEARAVRAGTERAAAPIRRQGPLTRELDEEVRRREHGDAGGEREVALARAQGLGGEMQRDERRGARGVDRHGRALEPEHVRHAAGDRARDPAGDAEALELRRDLTRDIAGVEGADEDAGVAAAQARGIDPRVLQRLPRTLQQHPLLRIHRQRLTRRDPEMLGVEAARVVEEPATIRVRRPGTATLGIEQPLDVPAAVGRERADRVTTTHDELPEIVGRSDTAREAAGHPDDRHRLVRASAPPRGRRAVAPAALEEAAQQRRDGRRGRVVEHERRGQRHGAGLRQAVAQLDRRQRVDPQLLERPGRLDAPRRAVAEDGRDVLAHELHHDAIAVALRRRRDELGKRAAARRPSTAPARGR